MKTYLQRIAAGTGFMMLLGTAAIGEHPAIVPAWLFAASALLLAGRAFTFQQKQ